MFKENNPWDHLIDAIIDQRGRILVKPDDFEGRAGGHPLYYMTFILAKSFGAVDWFNGLPLTSKMPGAYWVHSHHIFPQSLLYKNGFDIDSHVDRKIVNEIANRAFLTADSNISLSNTPPSDYLPEIESKYPGALVHQFIPMSPELWKIERYSQFLEARRLLIATKYNEHLEGLISKPKKITNKPSLDIIALGESEVLEFKSTLQWNVITESKDKALRKSVLKTIAAFLNTEGGTLFIGVEDNKQIYGLTKDLALVGNSEDKFLNLMNTLTTDTIGPEFSSTIKISIESVGKQKICKVDVERALIPAFLVSDGRKEFYVRAGSTSISLDPEETVKYINMHWM